MSNPTSAPTAQPKPAAPVKAHLPTRPDLPVKEPPLRPVDPGDEHGTGLSDPRRLMPGPADDLALADPPAKPVIPRRPESVPPRPGMIPEAPMAPTPDPPQPSLPEPPTPPAHG
jgi:hypothetical protein